MKLCLFCEHFVFDPGYPGWSEYTPGKDMRMLCELHHWNIRDTENFRLEMLRAKDCQDYILSEDARNMEAK